MLDQDVLRLLKEKRKGREKFKFTAIRLLGEHKPLRGNPKERDLLQRIASTADFAADNRWINEVHVNSDIYSTIRQIIKKRPGKVSLGYMVQALWTKGKIRQKDYIESTFIAGSIEKVLGDKRYNKIRATDDAFEMYKEIKRLGIKDNPGYIVPGLIYIGKIPRDKKHTLKRNFDAINYAVKNKDLFTRKIKQALKGRKFVYAPCLYKFNSELRRRLDRSDFKRLDNPEQAISDHYFRKVFTVAMRLYGKAIAEDYFEKRR